MVASLPKQTAKDEGRGQQASRELAKWPIPNLDQSILPTSLPAELKRTQYTEVHCSSFWYEFWLVSTFLYLLAWNCVTEGA